VARDPRVREKPLAQPLDSLAMTRGQFGECRCVAAKSFGDQFLVRLWGQSPPGPSHYCEAHCCLLIRLRECMVTGSTRAGWTWNPGAIEVLRRVKIELYPGVVHINIDDPPRIRVYHRSRPLILGCGVKLLKHVAREDHRMTAPSVTSSDDDTAPAPDIDVAEFAKRVRSH